MVPTRGDSSSPTSGPIKTRTVCSKTNQSPPAEQECLPEMPSSHAHSPALPLAIHRAHRPSSFTTSGMLMRAMAPPIPVGTVPLQNNRERYAVHGGLLSGPSCSDTYGTNWFYKATPEIITARSIIETASGGPDNSRQASQGNASSGGRASICLPDGHRLLPDIMPDDATAAP